MNCLLNLFLLITGVNGKSIELQVRSFIGRLSVSKYSENLSSVSGDFKGFVVSDSASG